MVHSHSSHSALAFSRLINIGYDFDAHHFFFLQCTYLCWRKEYSFLNISNFGIRKPSILYLLYFLIWLCTWIHVYCKWFIISHTCMYYQIEKMLNNTNAVLMQFCWWFFLNQNLSILWLFTYLNLKIFCLKIFMY